MRLIHVCTFSAVDELHGRRLTYQNLKAAVLRAGRFSVFEATATAKKAQMFTDICNDPEIETFGMDYPWTGVRPRVPKKER